MSLLKKYIKDKNDRNVMANILYAFIIKGFSLFVSLFSMPLYIKYFNDDSVLGLWYTILSVLSWINICDLGLGNGMRNRLTEAIALNDFDAGKRYISSTYVMTTLIIAPVLIFGTILFRVVDVNSFFNVSQNLISKDSLFITLIILLLGIGINFVLKVANYALYSVQKSSVNNLLSFFTSIIPLLFILVFKGNNPQQNLIILSVVHSVALNLPIAISTVILFKGKILRDFRPSLKYFDFSTAKNMLSLGLRFFGAQVFFMLLMSTNEILITKLFSAKDVVEYSIYYKVFSVTGSLFTLALTPLWSKVTKDIAEKNYLKVKKTNYIMYVLATIGSIFQFFIIIILQFVFDIWLRDATIEVDKFTALAFALFGSLYIFNIVLTTVANGIGMLKTQIVFYGIGSILKLPVLMLLSGFINNWEIVVVYNCIVLFSFTTFQLFWIEKTINNLIKNK